MGCGVTDDERKCNDEIDSDLLQRSWRDIRSAQSTTDSDDDYNWSQLRLVSLDTLTRPKLEQQLGRSAVSPAGADEFCQC